MRVFRCSTLYKTLLTIEENSEIFVFCLLQSIYILHVSYETKNLTCYSQKSYNKDYNALKVSKNFFWKKNAFVTKIFKKYHEKMFL